MLSPRFLLLLFLILPFAAAGQGAHTVVIDPGHGGKQPGTVWGAVYEKDIVLDISLMLGEMIKEQMPQVKTIFTRTTDTTVGLAQRAKIANDAKADLFLSIHVNATPKNVTPPSGALTLVIGLDKEGENLDMMATRENDVIFTEDDYATTYKEYLSGSSEMFILYSVMQYANIDKSIRFASVVQKHFRNLSPMPDKGIIRHPALVLWHITMPGVLVETGFLNNTHDREVLTSREGRRKVATAILAAVGEYFAVDTSEAAPTAAAEKPADKEVEKPGPKPVAARAEKSGAKGEAFVIQILSTTRKVPKGSSEFKGYNKTVEKYKGGRYRYYLGPYATRDEAARKLPDVRRVFNDAFITTIEL